MNGDQTEDACAKKASIRESLVAGIKLRRERITLAPIADAHDIEKKVPPDFDPGQYADAPARRSNVFAVLALPHAHIR